jgi:hypothetical protein
MEQSPEREGLFNGGGNRGSVSDSPYSVSNNIAHDKITMVHC